MPDQNILSLIGLVVLVVSGVAAAPYAPDEVRVGDFSSQDLSRSHPVGWEPVSFSDVENTTTYDLVPSDSGAVVRARSVGGASGLATECRIDLVDYPVLEWRWKVKGVVEQGDARSRDGDDYAARIYVTFDYQDLGMADQIKLTALRALGYDEIPTRALNYVWANKVDRHSILPNAYSDWVMMVAVRSGESRAGKWVTERRNVLADYRAPFGGDPPPVNGVAIMTDTDNTNSMATAFYGDIVFRPQRDPDTSH